MAKFKLDALKKTETKEIISRTFEIANNYAGELSIEVLSLDKIELDPENNRELALTLHDAINGIDASDPNYERKKEDWKSLESLAKTITEDQLINPIFVYRYGNKCRLIAGERRTLASAIAGKKEIIARIASHRPVGSKLRILQWIENNERVDLTLAERIANLDAIIREHQNEHPEDKITAKLLSDLTGMSGTQSRRYILILQSKPEIKKAVSEGKLENIKLIELICSTDNQQYQNELLEAALSGQSFEAIVKLKKQLEINFIKQEIRGRKKTNVSLGKVKPNVVKIIFDSLLSANILNENLVKKMTLINKQIQWSDHGSVENSFKKIVSLLDTGE